jgi:hypothetical protein
VELQRWQKAAEGVAAAEVDAAIKWQNTKLLVSVTCPISVSPPPKCVVEF